MTPERCKELQDFRKDNELTHEEIQQGWHFCPDWDFLLIGLDSPEYENCTCVKIKKQGSL